MEELFGMSFGQLMGSAAGLIAALSLFIEITPIKWNPVSSILNWIGERTNKGINDDMKEMKDDMENMRREIANIREKESERDAETRRVRILEFGDEVTRGERHSKERFDQILHDTDVYDRYCREHPDFINNKTIGARNRILAVYDKCCEENDFI